MNKKLLILGLLRSQDMHGYQLHEMIENELSICVDITKPTAYYLLKKMEEDGWIIATEEQAGNRPPRSIYRISDKGEQIFYELLRENLSSYSPITFEGDIGLAFSGNLPPAETLALLTERREIIQQQLTLIKQTPEHPTTYQWMIEHQSRHLETELEWLDEVIQQIGKLKKEGK